MDALKKNTTIKIVSVLLAVFLWLIVVNLDNPQDEKKLFIKLRILNEDTLREKGIVIKNNDYRKTITIAVKGREEELEVIDENDFTGLYKGIYKLPLKVILPDMVKTVQEYSIEVRIEKR